MRFVHKLRRKSKKNNSSYTIQNGGLIVGLWWILFIMSNFIGRYVFNTVFKQDTVEELIEGAKVIMVSDIM